MSALHPTWRKYLAIRDSLLLFQEQDGYLLFFMFRIAMISMATPKMIWNSSYVLISIILSVGLRSDEKHVPRLPG